MLINFRRTVIGYGINTGLLGEGLWCVYYKGKLVGCQRTARSAILQAVATITN